MTRPPGDGSAGPADELGRLRTQIVELDRALTAIRAGDVDAVVLGGPHGNQLYTLVSADRPYRVIVEGMGDGAVTVSERGIILYANLRLAELAGADRAALLGRDVTDLVDASEADALGSLLATTAPGTTRQEELELVHADGSAVPVLASVTGLDIEGVIVRCLVLADLTDRRRVVGVEDGGEGGARHRSARRGFDAEDAEDLGGAADLVGRRVPEPAADPADPLGLLQFVRGPAQLGVGTGQFLLAPEPVGEVGENEAPDDDALDVQAGHRGEHGHSGAVRVDQLLSLIHI